LRDQPHRWLVSGQAGIRHQNCQAIPRSTRPTRCFGRYTSVLQFSTVKRWLEIGTTASSPRRPRARLSSGAAATIRPPGASQTSVSRLATSTPTPDPVSAPASNTKQPWRATPRLSPATRTQLSTRPAPSQKRPPTWPVWPSTQRVAGRSASTPSLPDQRRPSPPKLTRTPGARRGRDP
jgi:hypothetical protein